MDRMQVFAGLLNEEDMANAQFISGQISRDDWAKTLQDIDERMSVIGLRLDRKPWLDQSKTTGSF